MKITKRVFPALALLLLLLLTASCALASTIKYGSKGSDVKELQSELKSLKFYSGKISGTCGSKTVSAIKAFQKKNGLKVTGEADEKTQDKITSTYLLSLTNMSALKKLYNVDWFKYKDEINEAGVARGKTCTLTDLSTGKSLRVYIQYTGNHADVEPLTKDDTKTLCAIYGVSSAKDINYKRRPALLRTTSGYTFAVSIYGTAHGEQTIKDNNYKGQFCLHFKNSKTHGSDKVDKDHQEAISKAVATVKKGVPGVKIVTSM